MVRQGNPQLARLKMGNSSMDLRLTAVSKVSKRTVVDELWNMIARGVEPATFVDVMKVVPHDVCDASGSPRIAEDQDSAAATS
jgi:hypothetical protein